MKTSRLLSASAALLLVTGALASEPAAPSGAPPTDAEKTKAVDPVEVSRRKIFSQANAEADRFHACSELRPAPATGTAPTLTVRWTVGLDGKASDAAVDGAVASDAKAVSCIVDVVHSLTFDLKSSHARVESAQPTGPIAVTFPLSSLAQKIRYEGGLSREEIQRAISNDGGAVRRCYEDRLKDTPKLEGKIVVAMTIGAKGGVTEASPQSSTITDSAFESCVLQAVRGIQFPLVKGGGVVKVSYPFVFSSSMSKTKSKSAN